VHKLEINPDNMCFESLYSRDHYITWSSEDSSIKVKVSSVYAFNLGIYHTRHTLIHLPSFFEIAFQKYVCVMHAVVSKPLYACMQEMKALLSI